MKTALLFIGGFSTILGSTILYLSQNHYIFGGYFFIGAAIIHIGLGLACYYCAGKQSELDWCKEHCSPMCDR